MATYTWIGASGADWSLAGDWTPAGGPPGGADTETILAGGTVTIGEAQSIGTLNLAAGSGAIIASAVPFSINGSVAGSGLLLDQGTIEVTGSSVTLAGTGTVALGGTSDSAAIFALASGNVLDNAGDDITGTGTLGDGGLVLTNEAAGVINAASLTAGAATLTVNAGTSGMVNAGLMEATSATLAPVGDIQNSGTIAANGGTVYFANAIIAGGTLTTSGSGAIAFVGAEIDGSVATVTNLGSLAVTALDLLGTLDNAGTLQLVLSGQGTADIVVASPTVTLAGGGTLSGPKQYIESSNPNITGASSLDTLVNVDNTIAAPFGLNIDVALTNEADGEVVGGVPVNNSPTNGDPVVFTSKVLNDGLINNAVFSANTVDQTGGGTIAGSSTAVDEPIIEGGTIEGDLAARSGTLDGSVAAIANKGEIDALGAGVTLLGSIDNSGSLLTLNPPEPIHGTAPSGWFVVGSSTVTIGGGGLIGIGAIGNPGNSSPIGAISAAATGDVLVNVDNTISGGQGLGLGGLVLDNDAAGLIEGSLDLAPLSLDNAGTVLATGGTLIVNAASLTNTGTMEADGGQLAIASGMFDTLPIGSWIADNSTIALPAPTGMTSVAGYLVLTGTAAEFVSSTGSDVPSLTNSYLAPETILAGGAIDVVNGATFGIDRTPTQTVDVGGTTVVTGGSLLPFSNAGQLWLTGGTADLTASVTNTSTLKGYGTFNLTGAVMDNTGGTIEALGGLLTFNGAFSGGVITIDPAASLELAPGWFVSSGAVPANFGGTSDLLQLDVTDAAGTYSAVGDLAVGNFVYGDTIIVAGTVAGGGTFPGFATIDNDGTALTFVEAGTTLGELAFAGGTSHLVQSTDANNDAVITVACFVADTRILTTAGEVPVEKLTVGDRVATIGGRLGRIVWLGRQRTSIPPVRIRAGSFGEHVPARDLSLSPDHAVLVDGVLVPVRHLINGSTVTQEPIDKVTYYHVELATHDVILAEELPCESYLDTGNRAAFITGANGDGCTASMSIRLRSTRPCG